MKIEWICIVDIACVEIDDCAESFIHIENLWEIQAWLKLSSD